MSAFIMCVCVYVCVHSCAVIWMFIYLQNSCIVVLAPKVKVSGIRAFRDAIRSWGWAFVNPISVLIKRHQWACLSHENIRTRKGALTAYQICYYLDLGLLASRIVRNRSLFTDYPICGILLLLPEWNNIYIIYLYTYA